MTRSGARRHPNGSLICSGIPVNLSASLCLGGRRNLPLTFVEIERRIQFGLAAQQFLEPLGMTNYGPPRIYRFRNLLQPHEASSQSDTLMLSQYTRLNRNTRYYT